MKRNSLQLILLMATIFFTACSGNKNEKNTEPGTTLISSDLEQLAWINQSTLVKDIAHSGKFSSRLDSVTQFSFGYENTFSDFCDSMPLSVDVSVWINYSQLGINSSLVMSIDTIGKNIYWKGYPLKDSIKNINQWQEIKAGFEIPKNILPNHKIKFYVWNPDNKTFYMDDLKMQFHTK